MKTIGERLKRIRLITQRPYHFFHYLGEELGIMLILEGEDTKIMPRLSFRGKSISDSILSAENYIGKEMKVGAIKLEEEDSPEGLDPSNEDDIINEDDIPDELLEEE